MSDTASHSSPQPDTGELRHTLSVHDVGAALVAAGVSDSATYALAGHDGPGKYSCNRRINLQDAALCRQYLQLRIDFFDLAPCIFIGCCNGFATADERGAILRVNANCSR